MGEQERQRTLEDGIFNRIQNKADNKDDIQAVDLTSDIVDDLSNAKGEIKDEIEQPSLITQAQNLSNILDLQNCLLGMGQNSSLPDQETLQTLNTLLNLQQVSQLANLGNNLMGENAMDSYIDAEDLHLQGEMENKRKKRKH